MFLFYFERIVRKAVVDAGGPADWALPYWNYGLGGRHATIPRPFRSAQVSGHANALFVSQRAPGINTGAAIPPQVASPAFALARPRFTGTAQFGGGVTPAGGQFFAQTGQLEQTPHNDVHVVVGGNDGWMTDPDQAAEDPIFWLHHANIDRLWAVWFGAGGHHNPTDHRWTNQKFFFFDADGTEVSKHCHEVVDTVADLDYTYDPDPAPAQPAPSLAAAAGGPVSDEPEAEPTLVGATAHPLELTGRADKVAVPIDAQAHAEALVAAPAPRVILNMEDIEAGANPGTVYGVYVNLPDGAPPDQAELHHAGNLSFFGIERSLHPRGDEQPHGMRVSLDITDIARAQQARGEWDPAQVEVTFRPHGLIPPDVEDGEAAEPPAPPTGPPVTVGRVSVYYE
jgi:tyrosinase